LNIENESNGHVGAFHIATAANTNLIHTTKKRIDFAPNEWFHIAGVYRPSQAMEIYLNGRLDNILTSGVPATQFINDQNVNIGKRPDCCPFAGSIDDVYVFNRSLSEADIFELYSGHPPVVAYHPEPAVGTVYAGTWLPLVWLPGYTAASHDVYMGENFADVNDGTGGTFRINLPAASTTFFVGLGMPGDPYPTGLTPGLTYYWRIDEVEADGLTKHKGEVWSFSLPPSTAYAPVPPDGATYQRTDVNLSWTAGLDAKLHTVYFSQSLADVNDGATGVNKGSSSSASFDPGTLAPGTTYYWRIDEFDGSNTYKGNVWSFATIPAIPITDPNLVGWWKTDVSEEGAIVIDWSGHANHGTIASESAGTVQRVPTLFDMGLDFAGDNRGHVELPPGIVTTAKGSILMWINTTQGNAANNDEGMLWWASQTVGDGYGGENEIHINIDDPGNGELDFFLEEDGGGSDITLNGPVVGGTGWRHVAATWDLADGCRLYVDGLEVRFAAHNTNVKSLAVMRLGRPVGTGSGNCYYDGLMDDVRLFNHAISAQQLAAIVTKGEDPLRANTPSPSNGAIAPINQATPLSWSRGEKASQHDVYFGADGDAVANAGTSDATGIYRGRQSATSYTPPEGVQLSGGPYYWRIDEVNTDGTTIKGSVWSFSVTDYMLVEDFESYNDIAAGQAGSNLVYETWLDGFANPAANGSTMGYTAPFQPTMETGIVHGGGQSAPMTYNNTAAALSEVTRTFAAQNWTAYGIQTLSLWFFGDANNAPGQLYVKVNGVKVAYDGEAGNLRQPLWQVWNITPASVAVNLQSVTSLAIGIEGGLGTGTLLLDDIRLYAYNRQLVTPVEPSNANLVGHWRLDEGSGTTASDSSGNNCTGALLGAVEWVAGMAGSALKFDDGECVDVGPPTPDVLKVQQDITIMAWSRPHQILAHWQVLLSMQRGSSGGEAYALAYGNNNSSLTAIFNTAGGNGNVVEPGSSVLDEWIHAAATYDGDKVVLYKNGQLVAENSSPFSGALSHEDGMGRFAINGNYNSLNGGLGEHASCTIDDVRIYGRALSQEEIAWLAGRTKPFDKPF
jgi:hypothetical protein